MRTTRWRVCVAGIAIAGVAATAAGCAETRADHASGSGDVAARITVFRFAPDPIVVTAGATVTWTNDDEILHTVTSGRRGMADGRFDGQLDGKGATFSARFDQPGTYQYHCTRHAGMDAVVEVRA